MSAAIERPLDPPDEPPMCDWLEAKDIESERLFRNYLRSTDRVLEAISCPNLPSPSGLDKQGHEKAYDDYAALIAECILTHDWAELGRITGENAEATLKAASKEQ